MVHVFDNDLPSKLLEIEGKGFQWQLDSDSHYSLNFCIQQYKERCLIVDSDMSNEEYDHRLDFFGEVIYGSGGMNRYIVNGFGEVKLSKYNCSERAIKMAIDLGFGTMH